MPDDGTVYVASMMEEGSRPFDEIDYAGENCVGLIVGSEGRGIGKDTQELIAIHPRVSLVHVPMEGIESLNVGVVGTMVIYEMMKQINGASRMSRQRDET